MSLDLSQFHSPHQLCLIDDQQLLVDGHSYTNQGEIGRGKSAISYLFSDGEHQLTVKRYRRVDHNLIPFEQALGFELLSYQRLQQAGVACPQLVGFCASSYLLVKEYIAGPVAIDLIARDMMDERLLLRTYAYADQLKHAGFHVDYFPANFVVKGGELYCIDYEAHPYLEEWDFHHWGVFYWLNNEGVRRYLADGDINHLNKPDSFKPWDEPFMAQRSHLLARASN